MGILHNFCRRLPRIPVCIPAALHRVGDAIAVGVRIKVVRAAVKVRVAFALLNIWNAVRVSIRLDALWRRRRRTTFKVRKEQ